MHVRGFTKDKSSGVENPGTFQGLREKIPYLKDLGVTHVQLLPVLDIASINELHPNVFYNWGYDPAQFMTLEGSYSSDPNNAYARISEFKEMVRKLHEAGIRVILDVVFNHVFELDDMPLQQIVPNYFFQMNEKGYYSNGSWCGNDFDSRRNMGRKYIIDCNLGKDTCKSYPLKEGYELVYTTDGKANIMKSYEARIWKKIM